MSSRPRRRHNRRHRRPDAQEEAIAGQPRKVFINLGVEDLGRSVDFFSTLGFTFDPRFTDDSATWS